MNKYKVTCLKCKESDIHTIYKDNIIDWQNSSSNFIVSARMRLDSQWGFQCLCGNNDILTKQEQRQITDKQNPDPLEIEKVIKNIVPDKPKFVMSNI